MKWYELNELNGKTIEDFCKGNETDLCIHHGKHIYVITDEGDGFMDARNENDLRVSVHNTESHELVDLQNSEWKEIGCYRFNPIDKGTSDTYCFYISYEEEARKLVNCIEYAEDYNVDCWGQSIWEEE